jgi:hypothetical protein
MGEPDGALMTRARQPFIQNTWPHCLPGDLSCSCEEPSPCSQLGGGLSARAFKDAWRLGRRCLVVTNGFYECKKLDPKGKLTQAYAVGLVDDSEMGYSVPLPTNG